MEGLLAFLILLLSMAGSTYNESSRPEKLSLCDCGDGEYELRTKTTNCPVYRGSKADCVKYLRDCREG